MALIFLRVCVGRERRGAHQLWPGRGQGRATPQTQASGEVLAVVGSHLLSQEGS